METITLELPDHLAAEIKSHKDELPLILELGLERFARIAVLGKSLFDNGSLRVEDTQSYTLEELRAADQEFIRLFCGAASLGHPTGTDNEQIDADLAREYGTGLK